MKLSSLPEWEGGKWLDHKQADGAGTLETILVSRLRPWAISLNGFAYDLGSARALCIYVGFAVAIRPIDKATKFRNTPPSAKCRHPSRPDKRIMYNLCSTKSKRSQILHYPSLITTRCHISLLEPRHTVRQPPGFNVGSGFAQSGTYARLAASFAVERVLLALHVSFAPNFAFID